MEAGEQNGKTSYSRPYLVGKLEFVQKHLEEEVRAQGSDEKPQKVDTKLGQITVGRVIIKTGHTRRLETAGLN